MLYKLTLSSYQTLSGFKVKNLPLTYQVFGRPLGSAPVIFVARALTGNSSVAGNTGWWKALFGSDASIDLNRYSVLCFDIPGNGYNGFLIKEYEEICVADVAQWFLMGLENLKIDSVYAGIGGSLGGSILWQMAVLRPDLFENLIPIATDWKATDWLLAQCRVQKQILENSGNPVHDARIHAMTFYRSAASLKQKFNRSLSDTPSLFNVESWLLHHGNKLQNRFHLQAYKLINHLLMTANIECDGKDFSTLASAISGTIYLVGIDSDGFYLNDEIEETYNKLKTRKDKVHYFKIESIHGHDAFLIEYEQLNNFLSPIFSK